MIGLSYGPGLTPQKTLFLGEKIFRLMEILLLKNSSPFFSKRVRVRASKLAVLLISIIKPYNFYYWYFLLRLLVSEIFAGPFHQAKTLSSSFTVLISNFWTAVEVWSPIFCPERSPHPKSSMVEHSQPHMLNPRFYLEEEEEKFILGAKKVRAMAGVCNQQLHSLFLWISKEKAGLKSEEFLFSNYASNAS